MPYWRLRRSEPVMSGGLFSVSRRCLISQRCFVIISHQAFAVFVKLNVDAMKLIIGLGNPGEKYERTRHNAGSWLIERFAAQNGIAMRKDAKFQALVGRHAESGVWLLLPQTFMNASGRPVQMMASFFKIAPAEILVVHDELDFAPGVAKIKQGGGIAGHNGLRDISARLGSHDYWRLRIGIGHPGDRQAVS